MTTKNSLIGIGTDIIAIERFQKTLEKQGSKFLDKVFTKEEQSYCIKFSDPSGCFAARFSAKEAVVKALGSGFTEVLTFLDIEIIKDEKGKPFVKLSSRAQAEFNHPHIELSISHCKEYATAFAIAFE